MNEYILLSDALRSPKKAFISGFERPVDAVLVSDIKSLTTIPVEHKVGYAERHCKTINYGEEKAVIYWGYECPFCGETKIGNYCSNCGAVMAYDNAFRDRRY